MKMNAMIALVLFTVGSGTAAMATPDVHQESLLKWSKEHLLLEPLKFVEKLKDTDPDFESRISTSQGKVSYAAYVDRDEFVERERIQYRPNCFEQDTPGCQGTITFEPNKNNNGTKLIKIIWGPEVLEDFQTAQIMMTNDISGVQRWYQGKLYNYETWHFGNNINAHFSVVSKRSPQAKRIEQYLACLKEMCQSF